MTQNRTGSCLCGAVSFELNTPKDHSNICHCTMCRKWSGGAFIEVDVSPEEITWQGAENIQCYTSSDWAERGFCRTCGSNLFFRVTAEGGHKDHLALCLGAFDDPNGLPVTKEIFIEGQPDSFALVGDHPRMTGPEFLKSIGMGDNEL